jgi:hypothetical protein
VQDKWHNVARDVLLDRRSRERGLLRPDAVTRLLDDHRAGRRAGGDAVWALLNLELWYRTFIDGDGIQTLSQPGRLNAAPASEYVGAGLGRPERDNA